MGADGQITIWSDKKVRQQFPNCDELFRCLPTHYQNSLDGKVYHHCYSGDNIFVGWYDEDDWYICNHKDTKYTKDNHLDKRSLTKVKKELNKFVDWLLKNSDAVWEVWT